jgi:hypothetical protein
VLIPVTWNMFAYMEKGPVQVWLRFRPLRWEDYPELPA